MADEDLLLLPQVPEAKPGDPEDVSWALSTAEAMWARGEHAEGVKWIRKAAEAASDAEDDNRALELAKAASELTASITRRSLTAQAEVSSSPPAPSAPTPSASNDAPATPSSKPAASVRPAPPLPASATKGRSAPPLPTSKGKSAPPPAAAATPSASIPPVAPKTSQPPRVSQVPRGAPRPLAVNAPTPMAPPVNSPAAPPVAQPQQPPTVQAVALAAAQSALAAAQSADSLKETRADTKKSKRRSRENIDVDGAPSSRRRSRPDADSTIIGHVKDLTGDASAPPSTKPFDTMLNGPASSRDGDRMTALGAPPRIEHVKNGAPSSSVNQHDPEIRTSQAVRVVVWRDATGVHVAPAGTVVSAITVDAVLVALEPSADLTAWLSERTR